MPRIESKLFKKYDIRGRAQGENTVLTEDSARLVGQAFGTALQRSYGQRSVIVGRDNRHTSPALAAAAIDGLRASGCDVTDIGLVSTPFVYWCSVKRGEIGAFMITGSHLAPDQNGFKLAVGARNLYGDAIQELYRFIEADDFERGSGKLTLETDVLMRYIGEVVPRLRMPRALKVVVDAGNGTAGLFAQRIFGAWSHHVTCIYCELDGDYPNHTPDPSDSRNLAALSEKVREVGADIGIAFDGDADRMGAVDEQGNPIQADRLLALLARDMLVRHPGAAVVADVLCSQVLFDEVARAGGTPIMWASGHSLVKAKMVDSGALLGGEMSGHIFLGEDYYGFDDAYLVAGRLLKLIASSDLHLSQLNASIPTLYSTPEYRPECPDEAKQRVIDAVAAALAGHGEIVALDGIRVRFPHGWGLLRASNTEPVLSLRFEGETEADAIGYRDRFFEALRKFPEVGAV